ncbi:3-deoxy-D-manno-octulosonic acid transferase [Aestuariibius sp. HNIBRBA575]|uniref:3-deoxy-D-manno-octulosonic acid transferase n=1 Tax=Aestuariibius sp. HNIBRBA575 TaxID=3233343 RepID=UPI0034A2BCD1
MSKSLPLQALMALRRKQTVATPSLSEKNRTAGPVICIHLTSWGDLPAICSLGQRICADEFLLSGPPPSLTIIGPARNCPNSDHPRITIQPEPAENRGEIARFLVKTQPDLLIWTHGRLQPSFLAEADALNIPRILINARNNDLSLTSGRWIPGVMRALLDGFVHIIAADDGAVQRLRRTGVAANKIDALGKLHSETLPLTCNEAEFSEMSSLVGSRPVWLAMNVPESEFRFIAQAHLAASRRAPRLLLLMRPTTPDITESSLALLRQGGLNVAVRSHGDDPTDSTQIYVTDFEDEDGLWLRLSPITFFGGTLTSGVCHSPMEAAALGSAILHGPRVNDRASSFRKLAERGAARLVRDALDLGEAVEALLAPDRSAEMALGGWEVAASGAAVTNRVIELIVALLDEAEDV